MANTRFGMLPFTKSILLLLLYNIWHFMSNWEPVKRARLTYVTKDEVKIEGSQNMDEKLPRLTNVMVWTEYIYRDEKEPYRQQLQCQLLLTDIRGHTLITWHLAYEQTLSHATPQSREHLMFASSSSGLCQRCRSTKEHKRVCMVLDL